jgi:predicted ATPase
MQDYHFHNFKCFQAQGIELRPLTLLTGLNGMGKSTVLQGLLLLRQSMQQRMLPGQGLLLNRSLVRLGTAQNVLYEGAQEDEFGLIVEMTGRVYEWRFSYEKPTADVLAVLKEPEAISDLVLFSRIFTISPLSG